MLSIADLVPVPGGSMKALRIIILLYIFIRTSLSSSRTKCDIVKTSIFFAKN